MPFRPNERAARLGLSNQLLDVAEDNGYYVIWFPERTGVATQAHAKYPCRPLVRQKLLAEQALRAVNAYEWLDGQWLVALTHPDGNDLVPREVHLIWKDQDGDVPFMVTFEQRLIDSEGVTVDDMVEQARQAYQSWRAHEQDVGVRPDQKRKAAQGEPSADPTQGPEVLT